MAATDPSTLTDELTRILGPGRVARDAPLAPLTTFRIGGPADWLADVGTAQALAGVVRAARASHVPVTLLGGGSNVLVSDAGIRGVVIRLALRGISIVAADAVRAEAGVTINGLVRWLVSHGLAGLEAWAGTPGTVGGAIHGNAHWSGSNIGDRVLRVGVVTAAGELREIDAADMAFAYDRSRLQQSGDILVWADFRVSPGDRDALRRLARESLAYRKRTQPLARPSAGCVFQNPDPAVDTLPPGMPMSAGALVDRAGLKGHRIGGAMISPVHANFIVNEGGATASDVRALVENARRAVREQFGVDLRDEVVYLGTFENG
jgi:UDP-N-acetylmuramate dehydrogenase